MHKSYETLGDVIKAAQQKMGITNEDLAAKVGLVNDTYIGSKMKGKSPALTSFTN